MREVGVRELKASLSEVLRAVGAGEHVRVTVRGKPVADIVPPIKTKRSRLDELIDEGTVTPATQPKPDLPPVPVKPQPGVTASDFVIAERESYR